VLKGLEGLCSTTEFKELCFFVVFYFCFLFTTLQPRVE
jgi:hypothetical protein